VGAPAGSQPLERDQLNRNELMTKPRPLPPQEVLEELFVYDPVTGVLSYRRQPSKYSTTQAGMPAGTVHSSGYLVVTVSRTTYRGHRIIWKLMTGAEPPELIDHKNRDRSDNRWTNLRAAEAWQNLGNRRAPKGGVTPGRRKGSWKAQFGGSSMTFSTKEEAHQAYVQWHLQRFGEFSIYAVGLSS